MQKGIFYFNVTNPCWIGYQNEEHKALFDHSVTQQIVAHFNKMSAEFPKANYDYFQWEGDKLLWHSYLGETEGYSKINVEPLSVTYNGQSLKVYPIGEGSWVWDVNLNDASHEILQLARTFSAILLLDIREEKLKTVVERNKANKDYGCASHDFCDANMDMHAAFVAVFGRQHDLNSDSEMDIWNEAWTLAKNNGFFYDLLTDDPIPVKD